MKQLLSSWEHFITWLHLRSYDSSWTVLFSGGNLFFLCLSSTCFPVLPTTWKTISCWEDLGPWQPTLTLSSVQAIVQCTDYSRARQATTDTAGQEPQHSSGWMGPQGALKLFSWFTPALTLSRRAQNTSSRLWKEEYLSLSEDRKSRLWPQLLSPKSSTTKWKTRSTPFLTAWWSSAEPTLNCCNKNVVTL